MLSQSSKAGTCSAEAFNETQQCQEYALKDVIRFNMERSGRSSPRSQAQWMLTCSGGQVMPTAGAYVSMCF